MWLLKREKNGYVYQRMYERLEQCLNAIKRNQDSYKYEIIYIERSL